MPWSPMKTHQFISSGCRDLKSGLKSFAPHDKPSSPMEAAITGLSPDNGLSVNEAHHSPSFDAFSFRNLNCQPSNKLPYHPDVDA